MKITNKQLTDAIISKSIEDVISYLNEIADVFLDCFPVDDLLVNTYREEMVLIALKYMDKYDPEKGLAYNYFVTIMACRARQLYRLQKIVERKRQ